MGLLALIGLGLALGLRHGIDWDHLAAIADITSSTVTNKAAEAETRLVAATASGAGIQVGMPGTVALSTWSESRRGFFLATMYALGHAVLVTLLGLLAIWLGAILPDWIDPIMERLVGVTLLVLGVYIFYAIWRYGRSFQLRSRWMLTFALLGRGWRWLNHKLGGRQHHDHTEAIAQYGWKAAFGIGLMHGIGAETGSQALLLASTAGATTAMTGTVLLLAFVVGLLISNSLVAVFSLAGFLSSSTKQNVYVAIGVLAGIFSLIVGVFFLVGQGTDLPDLQAVLNAIFGEVRL
jgi:high-affinity nickel-transport protein